jgi:hypothetical protein
VSDLSYRYVQFWATPDPRARTSGFEWWPTPDDDRGELAYVTREGPDDVWPPPLSLGEHSIGDAIQIAAEARHLYIELVS